MNITCEYYRRILHVSITGEYYMRVLHVSIAGEYYSRVLHVSITCECYKCNVYYMYIAFYYQKCEIDHTVEPSIYQYL